MSHKLSLTHLVRPPQQPAGKPPLLLLLHGVGSNERDLFSLAPALDEHLLILSVRAPNHRAMDSYAWFEVGFTPQGPVIDPQQAERSRVALIRFIDEATHVYGADPRQVYLMGFSQGVIMRASVALTRPELVAGAVLMSGRLLPEIRPLIAAPEQLHHLALLVVHGTVDNVLPVHHGRASRQLLSTLPVRLDYREYPMGHEITPRSLADVHAWLKARLDSAGA